jgi:hypothetical protein
MPYIDTKNDKYYSNSLEVSKDFPETSVPINTTEDIPEINIIFLEVPPLPSLEETSELKTYSISHKLENNEWTLFLVESDLDEENLKSLKISREMELQDRIDWCDREDFKKIDTKFLKRIKENKPLLQEKIDILKSNIEEDDSEDLVNELNNLESALEQDNNNEKILEEKLEEDNYSIPQKIVEYRKSLVDLQDQENWWIDTVFPNRPEGEII